MPARQQLIGSQYHAPARAPVQREAAIGLIRRLLGDAATSFEVEMIDQEGGYDVFEVESVGDRIVLRGSNGVTVGRALKWYLNNKCNCSVSWRGDNLKLPSPLPRLKRVFREATPLKYRYMFNYCTYGYSMAWWQWPEWERMIDVMALNGINLPLCLLGQEKALQEVYKDFGLQPKDLEDFFSGPAWFPWQWMGNLDGWGGPLPQSVIDGQYKLQKQILARARSLGMKPILPAFAGHVPKALKRKNPDIKVNSMRWMGFPPTDVLNWDDPLFKKIGVAYINKLRELYGTDHYYAIDPFNEMIPPSTEDEYFTNMGKLMFSSMDEADPQGTWVLMTWFAKRPPKQGTARDPWTKAKTKVFLDSIPDDRMLCLECKGEDWPWTGWYRQDGWYNKPWIWNIIQNFGDKVDLYGGLPQILNNYQKMQDSPNKGNPVGMGFDMEGFGCNPVVFELVFDMMWGEGVTNLATWQKQYVLKRYGKDIESVRQAWDILYELRYRNIAYRRTHFFSNVKLHDEHRPNKQMVIAWKLLLDANDELKDCEAYHFDLINVGRHVMGYACTMYTARLNEALAAEDAVQFKRIKAEFIQYLNDFDRLMGASEHFLLGRWLAGARSWGADEQEKALMEWGAKRQITNWGGRIGWYARKEWSGLISDMYMPQWVLFLDRMESQLTGVPAPKHTPFDYNEWVHSASLLPAEPVGDPVATSQQIWKKYGEMLLARYDHPLSKGALKVKEKGLISKGVKVTASSVQVNHPAKHAVDGVIDRDKAWWATGSASLSLDLGKKQRVLAFTVVTYWDWNDKRSYQYTIEVSEDGKDWEKAVDMSKNAKVATRKGYQHNFKVNMPNGFFCRYVRLNMLRNSANPGVHVVEFGVYDDNVDSID